MATANDFEDVFPIYPSVSNHEAVCGACPLAEAPSPEATMGHYKMIAHSIMFDSVPFLEQEGAMARHGILNPEPFPPSMLQPSSATMQHLQQLYNIITHL